MKKTEEECKQKEEECVNLELELTEVKENLKKALSGGVTLGLTIQPKSGSPGLQVSSRPASLLLLLPPGGASAHSPVCLQSPAMPRRTLESSPFSSCDTSDTESCSLPVNSASLLRRQPLGQKPSAVRGHVLRKAKVSLPDSLQTWRPVPLLSQMV